MAAITCNRCDGIGAVVRIESGDLVTTAPAYPDAPPHSRLKCAGCAGTGKLEGDGYCERCLKFDCLEEFHGTRGDFVLCHDCVLDARMED
jgi:hypothetical protein